MLALVILNILWKQKQDFINSHNTPFGIAMDYGIFTLFFLLITIIQAFRYYAKGIILASNKEKNAYKLYFRHWVL